jgi:type VI secretion system protein ImpK
VNKDDDFSDTDSDLTQIFPMPGGSKDAIQDQLKTERQRIPDPVQIGNSPFKKRAKNTLVDIASPLLILIAHVSNTLDAKDTDVLRAQVSEEINTFINKTKKLRVDEKMRQDATYILCVAVDEAVLNTPWGRKSDWNVKNLLGTYFQDVDGGPDLFEKLRELGNDPIRHEQLLQLIYYVLSVGYQGRYATEADASEKLTQIRHWVAKKILNTEEDDDLGRLSSHWKGKAGLGFGLKDYTSGWLFSSFAALLLAGVFTYFLMNLNISTAAVSTQLAKIQFDMPSVKRPNLEQTNELLQKTVSLNNTFKGFSSEGIVVISDSKVLISNQQLFESGSTGITDVLRVSLEALAKVLKEDNGYFRITGHSDKRRLGFRAKQIYGSNQGLSQQRADAVATILRPFLSDSSRIETQGKGSSEPIPDNKPETGRVKNSRVEIEVFN